MSSFKQFLVETELEYRGYVITMKKAGVWEVYHDREHLVFRSADEAKDAIDGWGTGEPVDPKDQVHKLPHPRHKVPA